MKAKRIFLLALTSSLLLTSACSVRMANMTPATVPSNPSGLYTLTLKADIANKAIDPRTLVAYVVIDDEKHMMSRSELGGAFFDYDYDIPDTRTNARFYYIVNYRLKTLNGEPGELRELISQEHELNLIDRYSISLDADRAPVGTELAVLGRGFKSGDIVYIGGTEASTRFISSNSLRFKVPALQPGSYYVEIHSGDRVDPAGMLRVDKGLPIRVIPESLELKPGEKQVIVFALEDAAPYGGLYLDVTTNIPQSVIMPEVLIPEGQRTVNVTVEGGTPGKGELYIRSQRNNGELSIPVRVQ
ncbi:IPT/TIG domain-containing protein [Coraliomargarita parva]|uniref:IPT/TIG domain-containing protein n=1 Tax=Coraliomargarita parva TaxID=3014050 RepID=UPI0022B5846C|nr:IPT/TIG domain-containing protein [Coraliomargarita parva]